MVLADMQACRRADMKISLAMEGGGSCGPASVMWQKPRLNHRKRPAGTAEAISQAAVRASLDTQATGHWLQSYRATELEPEQELELLSYYCGVARQVSSCTCTHTVSLSTPPLKYQGAHTATQASIDNSASTPSCPSGSMSRGAVIPESPLVSTWLPGP